MMNKRDFLKVAPIAAMTAATVSISGGEAQAFEMKSDKKYLIVLPGLALTPEELGHMQQLLTQRGVNATLLNAEEGPEIYELA
jgi:penicillin-binding protein-related factor A (putative recombinase)